MEVQCVLYVRISSLIQDYERQIADLKNIATENNFSIPKDGIFEDKLSGFKDENERIGLKSLMNYCLEHEIKRVLIWEISRLARKHIILLTLVEFFQKNNINIFFKNQGLWLLDSNGKLNTNAGMMISVMGWYGEYEANLMRERFLSQKILNESLGKYNGGKIQFGYKKGENKKYLINEDKIDGLDVSQADIVREVFDLYEKGFVCSKICRICRSKNYPKIVTNTHTLARVLRNTSYIGFKNVKLGKRPTPSIISEQQFYNVNNLVDQNKTKADKGKKHVYLLRGLITCSYCQSFYVGKQTDDGYICPKNSGSNKSNKNSYCEGGNISISNLDGVVWARAKYWLSKWKVEGFDDEKLELKAKIDGFNEQIQRYNNLLITTDKDRSKINFMFKSGGYTEDEYEKEITKTKIEKEQCKREIALLQSEIIFLEKKNEEYLSVEKRLENINSIVDRNQMKYILKILIKNISFYKIDLFKTVVFINYYRLLRTECIVYNSVAKKGNTFRLIDPKYFRFDNSKKVFYGILNAEEVIEGTSTKILKENQIGEDLPDVISLNDFAELTAKFNRNDLKVSNPIYFPIPDETNSAILDYDTFMSLPDIDGFISTHNYEKIEYFKDLKRSRFDRKR